MAQFTFSAVWGVHCCTSAYKYSLKGCSSVIVHVDYISRRAIMDFSRWTREKSIIAPSVKKYRVYTPYRGVKKRNYTPDGKNTSHIEIPALRTFFDPAWMRNYWTSDGLQILISRKDISRFQHGRSYAGHVESLSNAAKKTLLEVCVVYPKTECIRKDIDRATILHLKIE